jgi:hypothetical protein
MDTITEQQVVQLARSPRFAAMAAQACRQYGIAVPAGESPAAVLLVRLYENAPHAFVKMVDQAYHIDRAEGAAARAQQTQAAPAPTKEQAALQARFAKALPAAKVAAAWKELPAASSLRAKAKGVEAFARERMARAGLQPLEGLTAGETLVAYLHVVSNSKELQHVDLYRDLAAATANAFGDEKELRQSARHVGDTHRVERSKSEVDEVAKQVGNKQRQREEEIRKANGRAKPEPPPRPNTTREAVAQIYRDAEGDGPRRVVARNRDHLIKEVIRRKASKEPLDGLEMSGPLRRTVVGEARAQGYRVEEEDPSQMTGSLEDLLPPDEKPSGPDWKPT